MCEGENASFCTLRGGGGRFQIDEQDIAQLFFLWQAGEAGRYRISATAGAHHPHLHGVGWAVHRAAYTVRICWLD